VEELRAMHAAVKGATIAPRHPIHPIPSRIGCEGFYCEVWLFMLLGVVEAILGDCGGGRKERSLPITIAQNLFFFQP